MTSIRLLVVDDSVTVRAIVQEVVQAESDSRVVGVASSIGAARHLLSELKPNLISLDLNMPGVGGLAFLDELAGRHHAPIVVLSSSTSAHSQARDEAIAHGAEACFDKSKVLAEADRFRRLLHKVLDRRERQIRAKLV